MALTSDARGKLKTLVQQAKKLLTGEVQEQLQQFYGIRPDGEVLFIEQLTTTDTARLHTARLLRDRLDYLKANLPNTRKRDADAVAQLVREQAFTVLNRFASLRLAEERGVILETIRRGYDSEGFQVFDSVTGGAASADVFTRYGWYLHAVFDELALDLPALFDRYSPLALVFPGETALLRLLDLLNAPDLALHAEPGRPALNLWKQDETIGWMYQFYNSREEISEMREASAPRNARELAVRNQFFTPRYVVQFLTDNTLGRLWFDMTRGQTALAERCRFLVKEEREEGEEGDERKAKESPSFPNPHSALRTPQSPKDPREIRLLDPACGSMHFGLYAFDLFEVIYQEAWDRFPHLLGDLRDRFTRAEFLRQVPALILAHNLHGVDIDPRALQMAGLSLYLRAQRSFQDLGIPAAERPRITRANLVLAEALPGNATLLSEVVQPLEAPMRRLVLCLWQRMQAAGELGLVLKMETEIRQELAAIARDLDATVAQTQTRVGDTDTAEAQAAARFTDPAYRERFFETAETEVLRHLKELAEAATNGDAYQKLLFADDAVRGFAFIELCRQRYDVVVMNPPFGAAALGSKDYVDRTYPDGKADLAAVFVERMHELLAEGGLLGAISTRTIFFLGSYLAWRRRYLIHHTHLKFFADLGGGVLDAMVETAAYVLSKSENPETVFLRATKAKPEEKEAALLRALTTGENRFLQKTSRFSVISNEPLCYWVDTNTLELFEKEKQFKQSDLQAAVDGLTTGDNYRFLRNYWEVESIKSFPIFLMSDVSLRFFANLSSVVNWKSGGYELENFFNVEGKLASIIRSPQYHYNSGLTWAFRTSRYEPHLIPKGTISSHKRFLAVFKNSDSVLSTCSLWNSNYFDYLLKLSMEWISRPTFLHGTINQLPHPQLPEPLQTFLAEQTVLNHGLIQEVFEREETSLYFTRPALEPGQPLAASLGAAVARFAENKQRHLASLAALNERVYAHFGITAAEQAHIRDIIHNDEARPEGAVFDVTERELAEGVASYLLGVAFGRWDVRLVKHPAWIPRKADLFSPLPACSPATLVGPDALPAQPNALVSEAWLAARQTVETTPEEVAHALRQAQRDKTACHAEPVEAPESVEAPTAYPVPVRWDGLGVFEANHPADLFARIRAALAYLYGPGAEGIEHDLANRLGADSLEAYYTGPNRFFAAHLGQYTQNKRTAPIYWPLSVPSGRYTVWVYYPRLSEQTPYRIVSDFLKPKAAALTDEIRVLGAATDDRSRRQLQEAQSLRIELEGMERDLLRLAERPYRPNHDDGVLLTAAPLHAFFRHRKWQQATEAAWRELEHGDYDWAHLAYTLWPERVRQKCRTDLSLAIAHGLEDVCTVKPKEKKERKKKPAPTGQQISLL